MIRRLLLLGAACGVLFVSTPSVAWQSMAAQEPPRITIGDTPACTSCRIVSTAVMRFSAPGAAEQVDVAPLALAEDRQGRLWMAFEGEGLRIYDGRGAFLRRIGRSGQGPGEFATPDLLQPLPNDSMLVVDMMNRRATILDSQGRVARTLVARHQLLFPLVRRWPNDVLVSARVSTPKAAGLPLHVASFAGTEVTLSRSFASGAASMRASDLPNAYALVAGDARGGFVSTSPVRFELTRWSAPGSARQVLVRESAWFPNHSSGRIGTPTEPPSPRISAVHVDAQGRIWTFVRTASPNWKTAWSRFPAGARETSPATFDRSRLFETTVEVIDPAARQVILRQTLGGTVYFVLEGPRVFIEREGPRGDPIFSVERLTLRPR
ncbi:MAG TPA: hypothetical protein PKE51_08135 [Gemmatimonadaceae bacterium]|nr:hypothetical protein [Gemmatimonadaceae bacterium]